MQNSSQLLDNIDIMKTLRMLHYLQCQRPHASEFSSQYRAHVSTQEIYFLLLAGFGTIG